MLGKRETSTRDFFSPQLANIQVFKKFFKKPIVNELGGCQRMVNN